MPYFKCLTQILGVPSLGITQIQKIILKKIFLGPFQNWKPDPKVCSERLWLPISKIVWHIKICSVVWMLEHLLHSLHPRHHWEHPPHPNTPSTPSPPTPMCATGTLRPCTTPSQTTGTRIEARWPSTTCIGWSGGLGKGACWWPNKVHRLCGSWVQAGQCWIWEPSRRQWPGPTHPIQPVGSLGSQELEVLVHKLMRVQGEEKSVHLGWRKSSTGWPRREARLSSVRTHKKHWATWF